MLFKPDAILRSSSSMVETKPAYSENFPLNHQNHRLFNLMRIDNIYIACNIRDYR